MTNYNLNVQLGPNHTITSNDVVYDSTNQILSQTNVPTLSGHVTIKSYVDDNLAGAPISPGTSDGDFPLWNTTFSEWVNENISNPVFNANKINSISVGNLSGITDFQTIVYDSGTSSFSISDIVTEVSNAGGGNSLVYAGPSGQVQLYDIQSSDSTVNIIASGTTLDLTVTLPVINLENTADVTSFYLLSNPGTGNNPYTFLGLNTLTPTFIGYTNDSNNVYVDAQNLFGNLFYSNGTTVNVNQTNAVMGTYTVPANTLNANGKSLMYRTNGTYVCSAGDITIKANFGGQLLATIPAASLVGNSGSTWIIDFFVNRNSVGNLNGYINFFASDASSMTTNALRWSGSFTASGVNYATTNVMSLTVTTGATGIISWQGVHVDILGN